MSPSRALILDAFDLSILRIVQRDSTIPQRTIGECVNLSAASVQRRIRRMEQAGIIGSQVAVIDPVTVGLMLTIVVEVELVSEMTEQIDGIKKQFLDTPEIQQCYYVAGEIDFVLIIVIDSMTSYESLTRRLFFNNPNIRKFRTFVAMDRVKTSQEVNLSTSQTSK